MDCWHHEIDTATSAAELVRNAGEYLLLWAPRELSPAALGLARMRIESTDDIERVNDRLAHTALPTTSTAHAAHLRELARYFRHAATRIGELRRVPLRTADANRLSASL